MQFIFHPTLFFEGGESSLVCSEGSRKMKALIHFLGASEALSTMGWKHLHQSTHYNNTNNNKAISSLSSSGFKRRSLLTPLLYLAMPAGASQSPAGSECIGCKKWQSRVENDSRFDWGLVPPQCEEFVADYIQGGQYVSDITTVVEEAIEYAEGFQMQTRGEYGKDAWVFDIDETALSNVPFFANHRFGVERPNLLSLLLWDNEAKSPALPTLKLYNRVKELGFKPIFLTGRSEIQRNVTVTNLLRAGYTEWTDLILRQPCELFDTFQNYKSMKRKSFENRGYRIIGNIGDQWSDISGYSVGTRTFKLPNPMYHTK